MTEIKDPIRPTTPEAIKIAKTLLRSARYTALAVLDAKSARPLASRAAIATDIDGTPIILISGLAAHSPGLIANPSCSLLVGEPGKGDPLAYARMTVHCNARKISRDDEDYDRLRRRYLNHNPKGKLYVDLGDFSFFLMQIEGASLNGGFGKAFNLTREDLLCDQTASMALSTSEQAVLDHMNADHADAISLYAQHYAKTSAQPCGWVMSGLDPDGIDLSANDSIARIFFDTALNGTDEVRKTLVIMAKSARLALTIEDQ